MIISKSKILKGDITIWCVYAVFIGISIVEVFSAMAKEVGGGSFLPMFLRHVIWLVIGFICCFLFHKINYRKITRWLTVLLIVSIVLVCVPYLTAAFKHTDLSTARWIRLNLGFYKFQFQPSEIAKYITMFYTCMVMTEKQDKIKEKQVFYSLVFPILTVCGLVFWSNFSTAFLIFLTCCIVMLIGGVNRRYLLKLWLFLIACVALLLTIAYFSDGFASQIGRLGTVISRTTGQMDTDYTKITQSNQAIMAIATGGIIGKGIGNSVQSRFLDEAHNDFIFSIILEEGGIWLGGLLILLYIILLYRMMKIAIHTNGYFGAMATWGMGCVITLQALINMAVSVGLIPVTGQTLPFISYGGTSFVIASIFLGIIINISSATQQNQSISDKESITNNSEQ